MVLLLLPAPSALSIVALHQQQEPLVQILLDPAVGPARAAHQTRLALPPFGVEALDTVGQARTFLTRMMLRFRKEALVSAQMVGVDRLVPLVLGHVRPDQAQHRVGALSNHETNDLAHQAPDCPPEPQAGRDTNAEFIDLEGIVLGCGYGGDALFLEARFYPSGVCFRRSRMVWRPSLRARAMPR